MRLIFCGLFAVAAFAQTGKRIQPIDATFLFIADVHACRMASGLSPHCLQEGKTDAALLRNVAALNAIAGQAWPAEIAGVATGLNSAGSLISTVCLTVPLGQRKLAIGFRYGWPAAG